jgi:hypothetical protein
MQVGRIICFMEVAEVNWLTGVGRVVLSKERKTVEVCQDFVQKKYHESS